jgi:PilZ domain
VKAEIPVELLPKRTTTPIRTMTDEISLSGCYLPSMSPMEVGTTLDIVLPLRQERIRAAAVVSTKFTNIGNGMDFIDMAPADRLKLHDYINTKTAGNSGC